MSGRLGCSVRGRARVPLPPVLRRAVTGLSQVLWGRAVSDNNVSERDLEYCLRIVAIVECGVVV